MEMDMIKKIIDYNAILLGENSPKYRIISAEELPSKTVRAAVELNEGGNAYIVINKDFLPLFKKDERQAWIAISHEMRHFWQLKRKNLSTYQNSANLSKTEYNDQELEIDAWAWSVIVLNLKFGIRLDFKNLFNKNINDKIFNRVNEILNEKN